MSKSSKFYRINNILVLMTILFLLCNTAQSANNEEIFENNHFSPILFNFIKNHESNSSKTIILSEQDVIFYKKVLNFKNWENGKRLKIY